MKTFSVNGNPPESAIDILEKYKELTEEDVHEIYLLEVDKSCGFTDLQIKRIT